jgi:hypothetical protein
MDRTAQQESVPRNWTKAFAREPSRAALTWSRLVEHEFDFVKLSHADVGLSTMPLATPCAGQERAERWVTRFVIYAACFSAGRLAK